MSHSRSGCRCRQRRSAGVGEKVQHLHRTAGVFDFIGEPVPVHRLLREKSRMFEAERFQVEAEIFISDLPLFGKIEKLPLSAALTASVIMAVHFPPARKVLRRIPDDLGVRPHQEIISPALQFFPA